MERGKRRRGEPGFTLVELLVVIVILGILSGVVVFAVRGAGSKGRSEAVATDERILRTALETYCARNGHYPEDPPPLPPPDKGPMDVLVAEKFLSSPSEYHKLATGVTQPEGHCPNQAGKPSKYEITCVTGVMPNCGTSNSNRPGCGTSNTNTNTNTNTSHDHTGQTWSPLPPDSPLGFFQHVYGVYFTDALNGHAVASNQGFARTTDGGKSWAHSGGGSHLVNIPALKDVSFFDGLRGIAVGEGGFIFETNNGGKIAKNPRDQTVLDAENLLLGVHGWEQRTSPVDVALHGVDFVTDRCAFAVGAAGTILTTDDGGATWSEQDSKTTQVLRAVDFVDANNGYAVGDNGTMLCTTNGGQDWVTKTNFLGAGAGAPNLNGVSFVDKQNGHVVGDGIILNTTDAGDTWQRADAPTRPTDLQPGSTFFGFGKVVSVSFADLNHGTAVAQKTDDIGFSRIWATGDGGRTWVSKYSIIYPLHDVMFPRNLPPGQAGHLGYAVGGGPGTGGGRDRGFGLRADPTPPG